MEKAKRIKQEKRNTTLKIKDSFDDLINLSVGKKNIKSKKEGKKK
jgi:hypothetical protein